MPANFPEVWENRVRRLIQEDNSAPWLDGIPELNTEIIEAGSGEASELNVIHVPLSDFSVECLLNNSSYPIPVVDYTNGSAVVQLDKYQPKVVSISDDKINGAAFPIIDDATRSSRQSIIDLKFAKAAHSLAPFQTTANTHVFEATGDSVPTEQGGTRNKLTWKDLVTARRKRGKRAKSKGWRCVLSSDHVNDLIEDSTNKNSEKLADYLSGKVTGMLAGFEMFEFHTNPFYDASLQRKAFGTIPAATDRECSFIFHVENIAKKTGKTKQYFSKASDNPTTQTNLLGYRHYYIAWPLRVMFSVAIV